MDYMSNDFICAISFSVAISVREYEPLFWTLTDRNPASLSCPGSARFKYGNMGIADMGLDQPIHHSDFDQSIKTGNLKFFKESNRV